MKMKIIKDLRVLKKIEKQFGCKFDRKHKYCTDSGQIESKWDKRLELIRLGYDLMYVDGCFYPFLKDLRVYQ
jgi:hypothetical protein